MLKQKSAQRINRIVLYIDDLDRCPPTKVVEVLEAVHLLLAFPLFVVVVGVDARWISRSLEARYKQLLRMDGEEHADGLARMFGVPRSDDYLEKIFQIPLWLQPMNPGDVRRMVQGLTRTTARSVSSVQPQAGRATEVQSDLGTSQASAAFSGAQPGPSPEGTSAMPGAQEETKKSAPTQPLPEQAPVAIAANIESLDINDLELRVMEDLSPLLGRSPRALKRFVNVYRLIKARLTPREHRAFIRANEHSLADHEVAMFLLAVDTGLPRISSQVYEVVAMNRGGNAQEFIAAMESIVAPQREWTILREWLTARQALPRFSHGFARPADWVRDISRFSFQARDTAPQRHGSLPQPQDGARPIGKARRSKVAPPSSGRPAKRRKSTANE